MAPRRIRVLPLVLALTGLAIAGTAAAFRLRANRDVTTSSEQAYRAYHAGVENDLKMYEREAMSSYAEALRYDPHFVMATLRLADKMRSRDPERAASLLASAGRYRDDLTDREKLMLRIYEERWGKRDLKVLEALYDEYQSRFPKDPEGYQMRAAFLANNGRMPEAIGEYERLIAVNPNYAIAYNTLGYHWASKGENAKAEDYLKRYRYLASDQANPYDSLGEFYAFTGRYDEAEENLRKAIAIKDDFYAAWGHLGSVEAGRGNPVKAAGYFRKGSDNAPNTYVRYDFRFLSAMCLVDAGRTDDAVKDLDAATAEIAGLAPGPESRKLKSADAFRRAGLLGRIGRTAEAEASLASVDLKEFTDPKEPKSQEMAARQMNLIRGVIAMGAGRDADAVPLLTSGLEKQQEKGFAGSDYYQNNAYARLALATSLGRMGRADDAAKALAPILEKNPRFFPALQSLARAQGKEPPAPIAPATRAENAS
ncbi:MAG: tetratricopeptide repeat protein [Holophagales bacterium]|nr:tetratricopeptide repeat protein [Holophagales bacterium]